MGEIVTPQKVDMPSGWIIKELIGGKFHICSLLGEIGFITDSRKL